jgi:DNA mismatch repair protein MutS
VTHAQASRVPAEYVRRQTLTGAERYVTPELKEYEAKALGADERRRRLEYELFEEVRRTVAARADELMKTARAWRVWTSSRRSVRWPTAAAMSGRSSTTAPR